MWSLSAVTQTHAASRKEHREIVAFETGRGVHCESLESICNPHLPRSISEVQLMDMIWHEESFLLMTFTEMLFVILKFGNKPSFQK